MPRRRERRPRAIRLTRDPAVDGRHGLHAGRELEVLGVAKERSVLTGRRSIVRGYRVWGDAGAKVLVLLDECEVIAWHESGK